MALTALETKPIDEITAEDVRAFVAGQNVAESQTLELKQQDEQFNLRKAVCAFANAYGGTIVVGATETEHVATGLRLLEGCVEAGNRIGQSLADGLSPPVPGLRSRGVPVDGAAGVVVVRVPASAQRPHAASKGGDGAALHVFVRRNLESKSAGMREVQDMTLSATSQRQGVLDRIAALKAPVIAARERTDPIERPAFQVFVCATPQLPVRIARIDRKLRLQCHPVEHGGTRPTLSWTRYAGGWAPAFQSLRMEGDWGESRSRAVIHADGACAFHFWMKPEATNRREEADQTLLLGELLGQYATLALTCEKIRTAVDDPALSFVVSAYIACDSSRVPMISWSPLDGRLGAMTRDGFDHDLRELADEADLQRLLNDVVTDFHGLAGRQGPENDLEFDLDPVRRRWGMIDE